MTATRTTATGMTGIDPMDALAQEVIAGRCVAFVGAGFSAAVCRLWHELLAAVATEVKSAEVRAHVEALLAERNAHAVRDGRADPRGRLQEPARPTISSGPPPAHAPEGGVERRSGARCDRRRTLLTEIPFAAILTTNFDDELTRRRARRQHVCHVAARAGSRWLEQRFWKRSSRVLKLHGDLHRGTGVTLSRRGYRTRLYSEPGYLHVLRSVLLTKTVLFLGFSFTDEYLNELRSEVLAYLAPEGKTPRYAYALLKDVPAAMRTHFRDHEAMHVFDYAKGHRDRIIGGFDEFLAALHASTNPAAIMGRRLEKRRILWVDPSTDRNARGRTISPTRRAGSAPSISLADARRGDRVARRGRRELRPRHHALGSSSAAAADAETLLAADATARRAGARGRVRLGRSCGGESRGRLAARRARVHLELGCAVRGDRSPLLVDKKKPRLRTGGAFFNGDGAGLLAKRGSSLR